MADLKTLIVLYKKHGMALLLYKLLKRFGIRHVMIPYPSWLMIEPTNACNLHCPTCPTGSGKMNRPKRMMSFTEFKGIIDQVKGYVNHISLWNYGEPFLNRNLIDFIEYAVSKGLYVATSTNGEFFKTRKFCLQVVGSGLQHLIICLDGADQETINKFRKGSHFGEIVKGMRHILEAKKALESKTPKLELQFIVMKHNEHQRNSIRQFAKQLGVDVYREKAVGIPGNDPDFQKMAEELLPNDSSLSRYFLNEDGTYAQKGEITNKCTWVDQSPVINSDGTVVPCCYDLYSTHILGNIFEQSLKEIWKSTKYKSFRKQIRTSRKSIPMCSKCPEGRYMMEKRTSLK
jgi:radical SAM protein with 4Fe4S-binding SPASM domain